MVQLGDHGLSLRQLMRVARHAHRFPEEVAQTIIRVCMVRYAPVGKRAVLQRVLQDTGVCVCVCVWVCVSVGGCSYNVCNGFIKE